MNAPLEDQSLAELLSSLGTSIPNLVRDEFELLKARLAFALDRLQAASGMLVVATALALGSVLFLLVAAVGGLATAFAALGLMPTASVALAALAVALAAGGLALVLVRAARGEMNRAKQAVDQGVAAVAGAAQEGVK